MMGVTAAIVVGVVAAGTAGYEANTAAHNATNAHTMMAEQTMESADQILGAQAQQQQQQQQAAQKTASAQARVRAIGNPDGASIMGSPLGGNTGLSGVDLVSGGTPTMPGNTPVNVNPLGTTRLPSNNPPTVNPAGMAGAAMFSNQQPKSLLGG